ncbi:hypothetical protein V5O48_014202 [Marasmius crinis-equi]|uniref:Cytochrome P450 n=1 Tax=Marasmius crinis-equi TaxID=585013 RepID=A0ABR3EXZ9_9AGAR
MSFLLQLDNRSLVAGAVCVFLAYRYVAAYITQSKLDGIPTVGHDGVLSSYITAVLAVTDRFSLIEEGCRKYPGGVFKIPTLTHWQVIVNGPEMISDLWRAADDELSFEKAAGDLLQVEYTMAPTTHTNPYHINVVRRPLTRNIGARFEDILDETLAAFADNIPLSDDWVEMPVSEAIYNMVVRISNRYFVDLPLCRDPDWCDLNIQFTTNVAVNSIIINLFPKAFHPIVGNIFTTRRRSMRRAMRHLAPIIKRRYEMEEQHGGDWPDRPNDAITWVIDMVNDMGEDWQKGSIEDICLRLLSINFAAIHTTSMAFTHALYHLAANPHLIEPLREEVETVVEKEGWSKAAMVRLRLVDSFLKESQRHSAGTVSVQREALKDFRLSDGTLIPAGTKVAAANSFTHRHEEIYPDPDGFVASRFSEMRDRKGESIKHQLVTPTLDWLNFGIGKHSCPGRFFAATELKAMFAHLLLNYDVKFRDDGGFPPSIRISGTTRPNPKAKVMFRKRQRDTEV